MTSFNGIDVSSWQGDINWDKAKENGVEFAMIRLGFGQSDGKNCAVDKKFNRNMSRAPAAGVPVGIYFYSNARTVSGARREAEFVLKELEDYHNTLSYPVAFDLEDPAQRSLGKKKLTDMVIEFCRVIKEGGFYPILYSNPNWLNNILDRERLKDIDIWLAKWGGSAPSYATMWQHTDQGYIPGISGYVDLDKSFVDYPQKIREEKPDMEEKRYHTVGDLKADKNALKWWWPTIEKLIGKGVIQGAGGTGDEMILDLGSDAIRVLVYLDRDGVFG